MIRARRECSTILCRNNSVRSTTERCIWSTPETDHPRQNQSLSVVSQDARVVLKALATRAEANIAIDDALQKRITVRLKDVPFLAFS